MTRELITRPDGTTIDPVFDSAGRLDHTIAPEGVYHNVYSPTTGHLTSTSSPNGTSLTFAYDGSLPTGVTLSGRVSGNVGFVHDNSLRVTEVRLNGAAVAAYAYDLDSLVTHAGALTLTPDPVNGLLTATTLGNTTTVHEHDEFGASTRTTAQYASIDIQDTVYVRDAVGRITRKTETILGTTHVPVPRSTRRRPRQRRGRAAGWTSGGGGARSSGRAWCARGGAAVSPPRLSRRAAASTRRR